MRQLSIVLLLLSGAAPALGAPPTSSAPHGKHCLDEPRTTLWVDQTLIALLNPLGAEHQLRVALCIPLVRRPGILFEYTNLEVGFVNYLTPVYVHQGGYLALTPLSILVLGVEATGVGAWPIPLDGAGYFPVRGYGVAYGDEALPQKDGRFATGWNVILSATLRGELRFSPRLSVVAANSFSADFWSFGMADFYVNLRRDVIVARDDWILKNTAIAQLEIKLTPNIDLRLGAADDLTLVPRAGYLANLVAGLATLIVHRVGAAGRDLTIFVRPGGYTRHAFRDPFTVMIGVGITWELLRAAK